jgi:hypothetical protein
MGEVVEGLNGRVNLSGSSRGVEEKASGLPPVRLALSCSVCTGDG